jgi:hypothetical protein
MIMKTMLAVLFVSIVRRQYIKEKYMNGTEQYLVRLKYFDPNDNYWKHEEIHVGGYKNKNSHKQAGLDACREIIRKGFKNPEVIGVRYC